MMKLRCLRAAFLTKNSYFSNFTSYFHYSFMFVRLFVCLVDNEFVCHVLLVNKRCFLHLGVVCIKLETSKRLHMVYPTSWGIPSSSSWKNPHCFWCERKIWWNLFKWCAAKWSWYDQLTAWGVTKIQVRKRCSHMRY